MIIITVILVDLVNFNNNYCYFCSEKFLIERRSVTINSKAVTSDGKAHY